MFHKFLSVFLRLHREIILTSVICATATLSPNLLSATYAAIPQFGQGRTSGTTDRTTGNRTLIQDDKTIDEEKGFVTMADNEKTSCRDMNQTEAREAATAHRNQIQELRVITRRERMEALRNSADVAMQENAVGLKIVLRSTAQLDGYPDAKAAFIRAAAVWESRIKTPVTVVIDVDYGPTRFGQVYPSGVLGSTGTPSYRVGYDTIRAKLLASAISTQETALYNALPSATVPSDIGSISSVVVTSSLMRAFGLLAANADPATETNAPSIGFNSNFSFDFDPSDGITAGKIDFDAVAVHEMGHALGFISNVGLYELSPSSSPSLSVWDLFRFRPGTTASTFTSAQRILSSGGEQRFFANAPELGTSTGRPDGSGGDGRQASHWKADELTGTYIGIMDPTLSAGQRKTITDSDLQVLEVLGWSISAAAPVSCSFSLASSGNTVGVAGASGSLAVTAAATSCSWSATSNATWIKIVSGATGTGSGTVSYTVAANDGAARTGTLTIAGQTFTVSQDGCSFTLSFSTNTFSAGANIGSATVTANGGACLWTAASQANWITISSGASGTGNGAVNFSLAANTTTASRTGNLLIAGRTFTVTQAGATPPPSPCANAIVSFTGTNFGASGGVLSPDIAVTSNAACAWTAVSNVSWLTLSGTVNGSGNGTVKLSAAPNPSNAPRTGTVTVAGKTFSVTQNASNYVLSAASRFVTPAGLSDSITVTPVVTSSATRRAISNASWITVTAGDNAIGSGKVNYTVASNPSTSPRNGTITIDGQTFTVAQAGTTNNCGFVLSHTSADLNASGGTGNALGVLASQNTCSWSVSSNATWISITGFTTTAGSRAFLYTVAANPNTTSRVGTIAIAGQTFTVYQAGTGDTSCAYYHGFSISGSGGYDIVNTNGTCSWNSFSNVSWATLTPRSGTGTGIVTISTQVNTTGISRIGFVSVAGNILPIIQ